MSSLQPPRAPTKLIFMDLLAIAAVYVTGGAVTFVWSAYARALRLQVPRWIFFIWPLGLVVLPFLTLWVLHQRLEAYFGRGLSEERKATSRMNVREIKERMDEGQD